MNKKGFTLIELLGVILILGIIAVITVPAIINILTPSKESLYQSQLQMVKDAAEKWLDSENEDFTSEQIVVTLKQLKDTGYIEKDQIIDPRNKKNYLCGDVTITYDNNKYHFEYDPVSKETCEVEA